MKKKHIVVSEKIKDTVDISKGVFRPSIDDTYHITDTQRDLFNRVSKGAKTSLQKILLKGPPGAGKTEMAIQFAARNKMPMLIMDCANMREPRDWFGYKTIVDGKIIWHESLFDKVVTAGNHVILFDEINRVHPSVLNTLLPLLDRRGFTYLEEKGGCITVGNNTVMFATMNEGMQFTGTTATDAALKDRWGRVVEVSYLPKKEEIDVLCTRTGISPRDAEKLVDIANQIRKKSTGLDATFIGGFSTRQLIICAEDFKIDGVDTLTYTMSNLFDASTGSDSERAAVMQLIQGKFGR